MTTKIPENYAEKFIGKKIKIKIDRPAGSKHPEHGFVYETDYGYVPGTEAPDGEEIDAYLIGEKRRTNDLVGICVAVIRRTDDNDDKLVVLPLGSENISDEEIVQATKFQEKFFNSKIVRKDPNIS
ncbi:MAG: inorganic diphosphatase [Candidatus Paceibacterota bacterium]|jgi:inorganic pyrophosphatase